MSVKQSAQKDSKKSKSPTAKKKIIFPKKLIIGSFLIFLLILILASAVTSFELIFCQKVYPKVKIGDIPVGGLTKSGVENLLASPSAKLLNQPQILKFEDKTWNIELTQVGAAFDLKKTADLAFEIGRDCGNYPCDLKNKIQILIYGNQIGASFSLNEEKLNKFFDPIAEQIEIKEVKPKITYSDGKPKIQEGQPGLAIDRKALKNKILDNFKNLKNDPLELTVSKESTLANLDLSALLPTAEKIIAKKITLKSQDKNWVFEKEKILDYLTIEPKKSQNENNQVKSPLGENEAVLVFGGEAFDKFLETVKKQIETSAQDAKFKFTDGKVALFEPSVDGKKIEIEKLKANLNSQIYSDKTEIEIEIPLIISEAKVKTGEVNNFGIEKMIGRGWSNYSGSAEGRIHNVLLAASKINGTLIPPDGTFSFNQTVGEVSSKTGYTQAYIISKGRTILGDGGGVCQVSTTVFRGALYSGLPILERTAHAYRVSYYEKGTPVGLDATVYDPTVDLKFKNNTASHILIHAYADTASKLLYMDFYGKDDGRQVSVSKPQITNSTPPPPTKYELDETLPSGTIKQVDFSAWGASVTVTRKVTRGAEVLENNTFRSNYKPWQAVYKYGPGTPNIPQQ